MKTGLEHLDHRTLVDRLDRWNNRLEALGAKPLITLEEGDELADERLRSVVAKTRDRALELEVAL